MVILSCVSIMHCVTHLNDMSSRVSSHMPHWQDQFSRSEMDVDGDTRLTGEHVASGG